MTDNIDISAEAKRFRATVKHNGAEVGDLPWLEEFWVVRYEDYAALSARLAEVEAERDAAREALMIVGAELYQREAERDKAMAWATEQHKLADKYAARAKAAEAGVNVQDAAKLVDAVWSEYSDSIKEKWTFRKEHVENAIRRALSENRT